MKRPGVGCRRQHEHMHVRMIQAGLSVESHLDGPPLTRENLGPQSPPTSPVLLVPARHHAQPVPGPAQQFDGGAQVLSPHIGDGQCQKERILIPTRVTLRIPLVIHCHSPPVDGGQPQPLLTTHPPLTHGTQPDVTVVRGLKSPPVQSLHRLRVCSDRVGEDRQTGASLHSSGLALIARQTIEPGDTVSLGLAVSQCLIQAGQLGLNLRCHGRHQ